MTPLEQFTRSDVLRIVGITPRQLSHWERLRLVEPQSEADRAVYNFRDLIRLRTVKQLTGQRVPAGRLRLALDAVRRQWPAHSETDFSELRFVPAAGGRVAVQYQGTSIEPVSGQLLLDFGGEERTSKVRPMPERSLEDWLVLALDCEGDSSLRRQAIDAYRNIVERAPGWLEPKLNLGTLYYEDGDWQGAAEQFQCAVEIAPGNPLAHFNLGSVLDDLGQSESAAQHLEEALRLAPGFADAHYNLARIYEKLGASANARRHWKRYLELDPSSQWAEYARQRLDDLDRKSAVPPSLRIPS
ncbi:MAG TPA: tetratricopeptide repeat protein [Terriglobia bacterium]